MKYSIIFLSMTTVLGVASAAPVSNDNYQLAEPRDLSAQNLNLPRDPASKGKGGSAKTTIDNSGNYVADKVNSSQNGASKETNKEVAKDSNTGIGTRLGSRDPASKSKGGSAKTTVDNSGNYVADKVNSSQNGASKETNKEVAKDSNAGIGTRLQAAGDAISDSTRLGSRDPASKGKGGGGLGSLVSDAADFVTEIINERPGSKEANKEVAKDSNAGIGDRLSATGDAVSDKKKQQ